LCLGKTEDARDIESLVGSIPPQRLQRLAALEVPEPDDPVIAATGESASIGAPGHVHDSSKVSRQSSQQRAVGGVPHIHEAIIASTHYLRSIRAPVEVEEGGCVAPNHAKALSTFHIVILPMVLQIRETMVLQRVEREGKETRRIFAFSVRLLPR
jgi:hypothetical protein